MWTSIPAGVINQHKCYSFESSISIFDCARESTFAATIFYAAKYISFLGVLCDFKGDGELQRIKSLLNTSKSCVMGRCEKERRPLTLRAGG